MSSRTLPPDPTMVYARHGFALDGSECANPEMGAYADASVVVNYPDGGSRSGSVQLYGTVDNPEFPCEWMLVSQGMVFPVPHDAEVVPFGQEMFLVC